MTGLPVYFAKPSAKKAELLSSILMKDFIFLFFDKTYVRGVLLEPGEMQAYRTPSAASWSIKICAQIMFLFTFIFISEQR
jgi:hypothetical protein